MSLSCLVKISFDFQGFQNDFNFAELYDKFGSSGGTCFLFAMISMLVCNDLLFVCYCLNLFVMKLNCNFTHS